MATDTIDGCRRALALLEAGRPLPGDLRDFLVDLLGRIAAGDVVLVADDAPAGLRRAVRQARRDGAIRSLYALATGSALDRGEAVIGWHEAHHDGAAVPPAVAAHLAEVAAAGLPVPQSWRQIVRIAAGR